MERKTIIDLITSFPENKAADKVLVFLNNTGEEEQAFTFQTLKQACSTIAENLRLLYQPGQVVLLAVESQADFVTGFFGCMMAGLIPAPLPAIRGPHDKLGLGRMLKILQQDPVKILLVPEKYSSALNTALQQAVLTDVQVLTVAQLQQPVTAVVALPAIVPADIAYIQYTSGSTSAPKGVVLQHKNVLSNLSYMYRVFYRQEEVRVVGWLPFHHDMGLLGHLLTVLYESGFGAFMPASVFLASPTLWLKAITHYKGNAAAAPSFAFEHCCRKVKQDNTLDLSSWKYVYVGAETVSLQTLNRFSEQFAHAGFSRNAFKPVYGLAEATLLVAGGRKGLNELDEAVYVKKNGQKDIRALMPYTIDPEVKITIRDEAGNAVGEAAQEGEIWLEGPAISHGYFGEEQVSAATENAVIKTGDLGFISNGYLYITGRSKEIVIIRGVNYTAEDLEQVVRQEQDLLQSNDRTVCVSSMGETERFFVFQEVHRHSTQEQLQKIAGQIKANLAENYGVVPDEIILVPNGCIPKTRNYKIARTACLQQYLAAQLTVLYGTSVDDLTESENDAVVVVGMACRFPGADTPEKFWDLLSQGVDAITEVPPARWENDIFYDPQPAMPGKVNTKWAGFIEHIDHFDPALFGISAHEAPEIDPQQRLVLETSWRLLEHCGWKKERLAGSDTGIFLGLSTNDYLYMKIKLIAGMESFNAYSGLGNANSIAANRLSYFYDLKGPSVAVDTACSSSLTALHLAATAILHGDCTQAMVGGVNAILSPGPTITLSQFGMMSPVGRCKTFDESADGYVRAEGCGLVMLKRRSAALKDGDQILATIKASAIGQDGRSAGITSPSGDAQNRLLARTLKEAGIQSSSVGYIEAHGTGTALGDPVEMEQLAKVYGAGNNTCYVGSVKANIGHLEAGAGIAGVIKSVLMLQWAKIPPQIHFKQLNPRIHLDATRLTITGQLTDWHPSNEKRRIAVSSFGFGGALAHAILEEADSRKPVSEGAGGLRFPQSPFVLSAPSPDALQEQARHWLQWLAAPVDLSIEDICFTQALGRSDLKCRQSFLVSSKAALQQQLKAFTEGVYKQPVTLDTPGKLCFLFTGQGEHYFQMGRELYHYFPVFRKAFDRCASAIDEAGALSLKKLAFETGEGQLLDKYMQPLLFAVQYALGTLLEECGCIPAALLGHSLGEYAAACLAGCFPPETGMLILKKRAELMETLHIRGMMATVFTGHAAVEAVIDPTKVSIAALNSPQKTVISGDPDEIRRIGTYFQEQGINTISLKTQQAFHSLFIEPALAPFQEYLQQFSFTPPSKKWISSYYGKEMKETPDAAYWVGHARNTVHFQEAANVLAPDITHFIELGPGSSTLMAVKESLPGRETVLLRTLNFKKGDRTEGYFFLEAVCQAYCAGIPVRWDTLLKGAFSPALIPGQQFMHQPYWIEGLNAQQLSAFATPGHQAPAATLTRELHYDLQWVNTGALPDVQLEEELKKEVNWIVVGPPGAFVASLVQRIQAYQKSVFWLSTSTDTGKLKPEVILPKDADKAACRRALDKIVNFERRENVRDWKLLFVADQTTASFDVATLEQGVADSVGLLIPLLQAVKESALVLPVWVITRASQLVAGSGKEKEPLNLTAAPLWGFAKTLFLEHPEWRGGMIDIDDYPQSGDDVLRKVVQPGAEHCIAIRSGKTFIEQLVPGKQQRYTPVDFRSDGVYIITGGLGGLGLKCAEWLVSKGVQHLLLISRRVLPSADTWDTLTPEHTDYTVIQQLKGLQQQGAVVEVVSADIRNEQVLTQLFAGLDERNIPVRGVLHAAGVNWFSKVMDLDSAAFLETLKTKVSSSWALHRLTADRDLDCFLLFSSVSARWGSVDLSHYTAANYFMDMLSLHRAGLGLKTCSIDWGPWAEVGMSAGKREQEVLQQLGFRLMPPAKALSCMEAALATANPLSLIADVDWEQFRLFIDFSLQPSLFKQLIRAVRVVNPASTNLALILNSAPEQAKALIEDVVRMELRMVMLIESMDKIDAQQRFNFLGMDSLMAISFVTNLEQYFHCKLPGTLAYNYPTISAVRDFIFELIYVDKGIVAVSPVAAEIPPPPEIPPVQKSFLVLKEKPGTPKVTLFCFPYAGSGASVYTKWADIFGEDVAVIAVQPRGREERSDEAAFTSLTGLIDDLLNDYTAPEGTFYFFGHSLGALMAYEFYAALKRENKRLPARLFLSGCAAPLAPSSGKVHLLPQEAFIEEVLRNYGDDVSVNSRREALTHRSDLLRADLQVLECYHPGGSIVEAPLTVMAGLQDRLAPPAEVKKWLQLSDGDFAIHYLNGGHDLMNNNADDLVQIIKSGIK
jgi:acyl transferase domain-containing protein/acyl-CoA synthetase (AMP-forming)/AMP-acid ligase II/surfactin synthase thioesterase subunit/acyl carrier protein/NADP-dependent 3-hydroxy acid dehydrogenase YdfG